MIESYSVNELLGQFLKSLLFVVVVVLVFAALGFTFGTLPIPLVILLAIICLIIGNADPKYLLHIYLVLIFFRSAFQGTLGIFYFDNEEMQNLSVILGNVALLCCLFYVVLNRKTVQNLTLGKLTAPILFYLFVVIFTTIIAKFPETSFQELKRIPLFIMFLWLVIHLNRQERDFLKLLLVLVSILILFTILNFYHFLFNGFSNIDQKFGISGPDVKPEPN